MALGLITKPRKMPHWLFILQWTVFSFLFASVVHTCFTEGGWRLALNCFSLGFLFMSMVLNPLINRVQASANEAHDEFLRAAGMAERMAAQLQGALNEGRIEVIPVQPEDQQTRH